MTIEYDPPNLKKSDLNRMMKAWQDRMKTEENSPGAKKAHEDRMKSIQGKLKSGKKLSADDMQYLQTHDMMAYIHALRVQQTRKSVVQALKHAKSKAQARSIIDRAVSGISKDDPDREALMAAISDVAEKFMKSAAYQQLPETDSKDDEDRENSFEDKTEDDDDSSESDSDSLIAGEPSGTYQPVGEGAAVTESTPDTASFDMAG